MSRLENEDAAPVSQGGAERLKGGWWLDRAPLTRTRGQQASVGAANHDAGPGWIPHGTRCALTGLSVRVHLGVLDESRLVLLPQHLPFRPQPRVVPRGNLRSRCACRAESHNHCDHKSNHVPTSLSPATVAEAGGGREQGYALLTGNSPSVLMQQYGGLGWPQSHGGAMRPRKVPARKGTLVVRMLPHRHGWLNGLRS